MNKKVLVIYYSQSGQLAQIVRNIAEPLIQSGAEVEFLEIRTIPAYSFPWNGKTFFEVFPETVLGVPTAIEAPKPSQSRYDLVLFGYQPWYLSPSIPATSALKNPVIRQIISGTPVVTVIGARNMWISAHERVRHMINKAGGSMIGNIVLADRNTNLVSAVTIVHWMMGGVKDRYLGIFPQPGISDADIEHARVYGIIVAEHLKSNQTDSLNSKLIEAGAVQIKPNLMFVEERGSRIFGIWANLISNKKNRGPWLKFFKYYLSVALFVVSPVLITIYAVFFRPFLTRKIRAKMNYYRGVN